MRPIDADEALRMMQNSRQDNPCSSASHANVWGSAHDCCINCVDALPTLDVVPREEVKEVRDATVRKMHDLIEERCIKGGIYPVLVKNTINKVTEELLEDVK